MSVHTPAPAVATPRRPSVPAVAAIAARADVVAAALLALGFVLAVALTWGTWGDLAHDTGYDLLAADRVSHGQLPYVDFPYVYGPLGLGLLGGAFAAFGASTGTAIALGLVLSAAAVALAYVLARQVTAAPGAAIAAGLTAVAALGTGNMGLIMPHATAATAAVVVALGGLLAAARFAATSRRRWLVAAGVATGLLALTRPEFVAALAAANALWLGIRIARAGADGRPAAFRDALAWAACAAAVPAVVYGAFLTQVSPATLIDENLLPRDQLAAGSSDILRAAAPLTASSFASLAADLIVYACGAAALVAAGLLATRGTRQRRAVLLAGAAAVLVLLAVLAVRPEAVRTRLSHVFEWVPAGAAIALAILGTLALRGRRPLSEWTTRDQVALLCTAFLAVLAAKTYAAFAPQPNPDIAQFATYALPFAAVFMAYLHVEVLPRGSADGRRIGLAWLAAILVACTVLVVGDARDERIVVRGPGGAIAAPPSDGRAYQQAVDAIVARTAPGEPVLLAPQATALYTLTDRSNPLPQLSLLPGMLATQQAEEDAIRRMADVRLALTDRRELTEYGQGAFGDTYNRRLGAWLREDFERVATFRGVGDGAVTLDLWQRSAQ